VLDDVGKKKVLARLRRIGGQIEGIARMIEEDRYCVDVLLQCAAVLSAVRGVSKVILRAHVGSCVASAMATGNERQRKQKLDELLEVFARHGALGGSTSP
jgi:CsoR family transcriptional regulator, copper-sensing transcriptional repressor